MTTTTTTTTALTTTQARTAQAIVNLFETSRVLGDYGKVTLIDGDTGHLTFGRSQTTLGSGNLHGLVERYCRNAGARFGPRLAAWLPRIKALDFGLDADKKLHNVLRASADDPVMRETQDVFFDETYFQPAMRTAGRFGIQTPLGRAVVYDSYVHGSWGRIRDQVAGTPATRGEQAWIADYVKARRHWLATNGRADLRATVYRMDAFQRLIDQGFWGLELPLVVRGQEISALSLNGLPEGCYDGPAPGSRVIEVSASASLPRGLDVRLVQLGLSDRGVAVTADGVFGRTSANLVRDWQRSQGLPATGIADVGLIMALTA